MRTTALLLAAVAAAVFSVLMLVQSTLYAGALCLLVVLLQLAAMFYLLGAPLLGFLQVMIYAGAIMVMMVVAVMALPPRLRQRFVDSGLPRPALWLALALVLGELLTIALPGGAEPAPWPNLIPDVGAALFGPYALYTESLGILVLVSALAVVSTWEDVHE